MLAGRAPAWPRQPPQRVDGAVLPAGQEGEQRRDAHHPGTLDRGARASQRHVGRHAHQRHHDPPAIGDAEQPSEHEAERDHQRDVAAARGREVPEPGGAQRVAILRRDLLGGAEGHAREQRAGARPAGGDRRDRSISGDAIDRSEHAAAPPTAVTRCREQEPAGDALPRETRIAGAGAERHEPTGAEDDPATSQYGRGRAVPRRLDDDRAPAEPGPGTSAGRRRWIVRGQRLAHEQRRLADRPRHDRRGRHIDLCRAFATPGHRAAQGEQEQATTGARRDGQAPITTSVAASSSSGSTPPAASPSANAPHPSHVPLTARAAPAGWPGAPLPRPAHRRAARGA